MNSRVLFTASPAFRKYSLVYVASIVFCVLIFATQIILAADYTREIPPEYQYQTINIFPGSVSATGWNGTDATFSQDADEDALYAAFNENNSVHVVLFVTELSTPPSIEASGIEENIVAPVNDVPLLDSVDVQDDVVDSGESAPEAITNEPILEPESELTPEPPASESAGDSPVVFQMVRGIYDFAVGMFTSPANEHLAQVDILDEQPLEQSTIEATESVTEVDSTITDTAELSLPIVDESQSSETPLDILNSGTETGTESVQRAPDAEVSAPSCENGKCFKHVLEFSDFGTGGGLDEQQITNMQLRISLGAKPNTEIRPSNDHIRIEYLHYDYWIDGGVIPLDEEVSNAINGGYFLFAFPLYSEWDEMKRIKVRLTYESDNVHLADIYIDSVWLEVESIDNNAFNEPEPVSLERTQSDERQLRRHVPEGYSFNMLEEHREFSHDENPNFKFRVEKQQIPQGLLSRIGSGIRLFFGFGEEDSRENENRMQVRVVNEEFKNIARIVEDNGEFTVDIPKMRQFKPGKHIISIEVFDGSTSFFIDQEFSWGVLALNVDKSMYLPNEEAYIQMGVLDDLGHTICDATLNLEVTNPNGVVRYLGTEDGTVEYGDECAGDTFTSSPDYAAHYETDGGVGEYTMKLTATTGNGTHTITDTFEVRESVPFDITRTGPTRIYPPELYPVTLTISAREEYVGQIIEYVPASFQVYEASRSDAEFRTHEVGDAKQLIWDVSLEAGETVELAYRFDAPDISPEFYLLGPLEVGSFKEIREWQIASDAPDNAVIVQSVMGTEVSGTSYSATFGTAPTAGNTIIMVATHMDGASAFNAPASYLTQAVLSNATVEVDSGIWYAPANSASTTYTITKTGGNQTGIVYLMEVSGLDTTNLLSATSSNDQTGSNSLTASTSLSGTSTQYAFAIAGITFADNDFAVPTSASWSSGSAAPYAQQSTVNWATGNDGTFSIATANINVAARQGATQVLTVGGTEQRNSVLAVFKLRPQSATVGARGNQTAAVKVNTANNYVGGAFTVLPITGYATVTSMTVTETGTTNAQNDLSSIRLYYESDATAPYDCASSTYDGNELQFGATSTSFSSANGTSTFSGTVRVATTSMLCVYPVLNVDASATPGDTLELQITTPNTEVVMSEGSTTPGTAVAISDTTTLVIGFAPTAPLLTATTTFPFYRSTTTQPTFSGFAATDSDGDRVEFEFIIDNDPLFASPATTTYSSNSPSDAGWASSTFVSGATTTYRIQQPLTVGETYWWKVRARDPQNTNTWSSYSEIRSITVSDAITVPEWFQTTDTQFGTSTTLSNATTSGNGSVEIVSASTSVALLNAWSTGNTKVVSTSSTDRILVVAIISEDNATAVNVNTVTYGGSQLTEIDDQQIGTGFSNGMWVGYLLDAGISSSTNTTITPTWTGGTPGNGIQYASAVFSNVNQSAPIRGSSGNALTAGTTITPSAAISVSAGDMMLYISETADGLTHTPPTNYTEGIEQDTGGNGFVDATAYKAATTSASEFPTATWSASGNRLLMVAVALKPSPAEGTILSPVVDFDWVASQSDWGEVQWNLTETAGYNSRLQLLYASSSSSTCTTLIPNSALANNSIGFVATGSPLSIMSLATSTYNRICLKMTLDMGDGTTSPSLDDWTVSWERSSVLDQTAYRWYVNFATSTATDTWPFGVTASELSENEAINATFPTKTNDVLRLRLGVTATSVSAVGKSFALQYAEADTCTAGSEWAYVGAIGSTTALWRGYDNAGVSDGQTLASSTLSSTDVFETYEEENLTTAMPNTIAVGQQGEWDWIIQNRANAGTEYCFRMVNSDGVELNSYTQYGELITNQSPSITSVDTPFDNEKMASTSPWFEFAGVDPEADELDYQIQIDNDSDFSSTVIDTDSVVNINDFENLDTPADKSPFFDSETIRYSIPSVLSNGTTYWWRIRAVDTNGSGIYGDWITGRSFTIDTGVTITTWYQTTEEQFDTDTLLGIDATGSDLVTLISGSTTGTTTSSEIDFDNFTTGNAWGELLWNDNETTGDIKYHLEYYDGSSWTLIPDTALVGNATGFDTSPVDLIDLDTETYNQIRIRANFTNSGGAPTLSDWTVTWGLRVSVPTHLLLFDNEKTGTTTPTFTFYTTDPQNEDLEYEISWSTDNTFSSGTTTRNSSTTVGFLNTEVGGDLTPFYSGDVISYVVQPADALTNGSTYWWRLRARDINGGNSFSFWSEPWSFTVDTAATTSTWFQTTQEQFDTDTMISLFASTSDSVSTNPAGVTTYNFAGITNPSATHVARYFEVGVSDPTDPPTYFEIDTLTVLGTAASTPNLRTGIAGHAGDVEASTAQYTAISSSNDSSWTTADPGAGDQAIFWAEFAISEAPADIDQIDILIEARQGGVPAGTDKGWFGIWRPGSTTPYWFHASSSQRTADANYTYTITTNISEYFDASNKIHLIYFNEDDSDPVIIDYVEVEITTGVADSGVITATPVDFNDGSGPIWGQMSWVDSEPGFSTITYQLEYLTSGGVWTLIPDGALAGNSTGFSTSPVSLTGLNTTTYNEIRLVGNFDCVLGSCPTLNEWTIRWSPGFTITGTAFEYDGISSTTAGTVAVAINGTLQNGKTGSISNGSWSISNVTFFDDDIITVFVSNASSTDEAVAVTQYDGTPDMSGLTLRKQHLTIGSNDYESLSNSEIAHYDFTDDEDLFFDVDAGNDLTLCADTGCGDASIVILPRNTYDPGTGGNVTTHDFVNNGTFTSGANTIRVSGSWDDNATTTLTNSTVIFTATSTTESIDERNATTTGFNTLTLGETSGTATWNASSSLDINGNLSVAYGTFARSSSSITLAGNLSTGASGFWSGMGTTTFDGTNPSTWIDQNATDQNIGRVVVDGTAKTLLLDSTVVLQSLLIGADDTFDVSNSGHAASVYENWINNNTFTARTGTVNFIATTTNRVITAGGDAFYNLSFNGVGGLWSFTETNLSVTNDFAVATGTVTMPTGTTTISGSFANATGTFAHNNGTVLFDSSSAETIKQSGTAFTNAFYNVRFAGSGSWVFSEANATTTNDFRIGQGTVTFPGATLSVGGNFENTAGTFNANSGTVRFTGSGTRIIDTNSSFYSILFTGSSTSQFTDTNVTASEDLSVTGGTITFPSGTFTIGGSISNTGTINANSGTVLLNSSDTGETIALGNSSLNNLTVNSGTGGWTVSAHATTTGSTTLNAAGAFTLASGQTLSVGTVFTNSVGGASTTWTGATLSLESGAYTINTKTAGSDVYDTLRIKANTDIKMWNSSASTYTIDSTGSLYSEDHSGTDGDLYIYGSYERVTGTEYWSYATDFDGTSLGTTSRQVDVRLASGASASFSSSTLSVVGTSTGTTTIRNQGSGTYTVSVYGGTTTASFYDFGDLGSAGLILASSTEVTSLSDGRFAPSVNAGTGITVSSTTVDANPALQIFRVKFSTTTAISATNVTQSDGAPASYWWFRDSLGNIDGEAFDNDTGDPGSIRWDDSSLTITVSGTVYDNDGTTLLGAPTCGVGGTPVRIVIENGGTYDGACDGSGAYSIPGVIIIGDPTLTVFLNGAGGGERAVTVTKTPTADITDLDLIAERVIVRHEDTSAMTIADMSAYDNTDDADIPFIAATGTSDVLTVSPEIALQVWATTTFTPSGSVTLQSGGSGASYDGSLYIGNAATFTGAGTTTYAIGGSLTQGIGGAIVGASTTIQMTATTTGKGIVSASLESISLNNLMFTGVGGGWNLNGNMLLTGELNLATGTLTGTGDITLANSSFYGNGLLSLGTGTTTLVSSNTLGGTQAWMFANLVLGTGSVTGTTSKATTATTTVLDRLTLGTGHFFNAFGSILNLQGSGNVFVENGTFVESTSTVRYGGTGGSNVLSTTYYNLLVNASGGTPTYTGTGLGIIVTNALTVGGTGNTTLTLDTSDPTLDVNGNVTIESNGTLVGSASASFTVAGSWDNNGTFTGSGGTVTFDNGGTKTIAAGNSSFSSVVVNGAGTFTFTEHATATSAFTLTSATSFTVQSGVALAVGGVFTNALGGANTVWTDSTLFLYGGGNYQINPSTVNDTYGRLAIASNTQIRMWNSSASTTDLVSTASLYSQDHASVNGNLYLYGAYTKSSGNDYWSYATDFDGTALGGSSRQVDVRIAGGGSVLYTGGGLSVLGTSTASTSIQNQGSGTYSIRIGGSASTTWNYYDIADFDTSGLTFSGTPVVNTLAYGAYTVGVASGTAITVGGTVINQNPAKTFTGNTFGTSTGGLAFNVTATGTTVSSWRFTNHAGVIDGESYDVDPDGDPGYIVWDDSAASLSFSGRVYSDEGSTVSGVCDGSTNIHLRVAGLTSYTTDCNAGTGLYTFTGVTYSPGDSFVIYIEGETEKGAVVSEDPVTSIGNLDIYENRVIVRHEGADPLSIADMSVWDSSDAADIPFTAIDASPDTLVLPANRKLLVWTGKEFEPNGNVTVSGGGAGAAYDGTVELQTNAIFDATGAESHSIGGSLIMGAGATLDDETSTFTFTTSGAARTIDTNDLSLYSVVFNGVGSWTITNTALDIGNDFTLTQGTLTLPTGTTTVAGSFLNTGGTFIQNGGRMYFTSAGAESIRVGGSAFGTTTFVGGGSWTYLDTHATTTGDFTIQSGTVTSASGTLTVGGDFTNSGTFIHNSGVLRMISSQSSTTIHANSSDFYSVTIAGTGTFLFTDSTEALLGSLTLLSGTTTLPTSTISIGGSLLSVGGSFIHSTGTILMNSSDTGELITSGTSVFSNLTIAAPTGGYTITDSGTTTNNFSLTSARSFALQSGRSFGIQGVFTNLVGGASTTWTGTTLNILSGTGYTVNSKTQGGDAYNSITLGNNTDLRFWNSQATTSFSDALSSLYSQDNAGIDGELYIYGNYTRTTGADYWSYATDFDGANIVASSRAVTVRHASGATSTFSGGSLNIIGSAIGTTTVTNQGSGTYAFMISGGTLNAQNYALRNMDVSGLVLSGETTVTSIINGDLELAVNGGALITLSSTTLNYNASAVITGMKFATTTAITGANVALVGTTSSAWTFTGHRGNFDGEALDSDGIDACGSVRWDDSACLLTQQSAYRWRNNDGGEGVPDSEWYDTNWSKRKRITLTNSDATTYTNAAVEVTVPFDVDMQTDFDDVRVTDESGTTTLNFVRETYVASTEATFWIQVPSLPASSDVDVYLYYGNGSTPYGGVGTTTFTVYDDFEDNNISEYSGDTTLFTTDTSFAYQGTYGLEAVTPSDRTTDGIYRTSASSTVSQGETIRFLQYINTGAPSDETCTLFGVQAARSNYAVCLEQLGVDRVSIVQDAYDRDSGAGVTGLASTTITYTTGWYEIEIDWEIDDSIDVYVYRDDTLVATTSATDSSYTTGGVGFTFWGQNGGWDFYTSRPLLATEPTTTIGYEQVRAGASWASVLNGEISGVNVGTIVRPRFVIENTGLSVSDQYQLMFAEKGASPSCESVSSGSYSAVPAQASCGTSAICMQSSAQFTNNAQTTDVLGGAGVFTPGEIIEDPSNKTSSLTIDSDEYTEVEYAIVTTVNATDPSYCFRVSDNGASIDSYTNVAELSLTFAPSISSITFNDGLDITLSPGATTTIYATGTVSDQNGYADITEATTTMFRSGVGASCSADTNSCYIAGPSQCSYVNCSGNSCDVVCTADFFYHADPTDAGAIFDAQSWGAELSVRDQGGLTATQTAPYIDLLTLRAFGVDSLINYGSVEVSADTGSYNASTTFQNLGNDAIDVAIEGTNLTDGVSSNIPVNEQIFATSTFTYSACVYCTQLSASSTSYELDLAKPASTTPAVTDNVFWGIAIPFGISAAPHQGTNIFYAIGD